ncbi:hypothetical protein ASPFODRAFT_66159 [Aspergillus luchuensis CBS 106.47]|uniref:Uncharacterized protein n=1 Tax=Aspergillus luchuensis (strain CBS 106.47) TaxID=1137211 RepID=A0A1M3TXP9_ASPLC|nr:hypothetical protein ASPFODRAFT_66159 [Aspergillus luchuensis CBS 106.47]
MSRLTTQLGVHASVAFHAVSLPVVAFTRPTTPPTVDSKNVRIIRFYAGLVVHNRMSRVKKLHLPLPTAGIKTDVWNFPNEIVSQITTLAAVLQVQQQQRTPLAKEEEEDEEETDDEETSNEQLHNHELGSSAVDPRKIDEVDRFIIACQTHEFPKDYDVARAFGILYFTSAADQHRLFGLYCRLVKDWGVGEEELRDAWQQDKLKEFILFRSSQIPSTWIQNESHWISQQDGFAANKETHLNIVFESQKHVLKLEDQQVPYQLLKPREKLEAYVFLCQIRNGYIPDTNEDNWISLGFCTARDDGETQQMEKLYGELLDRCVFEEFWKAMAESKMVDLFRKYGFGDAIAELRNFETLLSAVGTRHQSVWELKRFTRLSSPQPHRSVTVDYGFYNCRTPLELSDLRQAYTNFFAQGGDEMALHEACIQGQLAPFLGSELEGLPISPELVSNPYPLQGWVFETVCLVPQSIYGEAKKWQTQRGEKMTIMIHPDEFDEASGQLYLKRSKYLGLSMETQTTLINGQLVESMSGM